MNPNVSLCQSESSPGPWSPTSTASSPPTASITTAATPPPTAWARSSWKTTDAASTPRSAALICLPPSLALFLNYYQTLCDTDNFSRFVFFYILTAFEFRVVSGIIDDSTACVCGQLVWQVGGG